MNKNKILLTAFRGSSAEQLLKYANGFDKLILPNDKVGDAEKLKQVISKMNYDFVVSLGQKPNIKNKVHIETTAKSGDIHINTDFDCDRLKVLFEQNGIDTKISHNAGTSYCNSLFYNGMDYIKSSNVKTQMVFVHIPFTKNIDEPEIFFQEILKSISEIWEN